MEIRRGEKEMDQVIRGAEIKWRIPSFQEWCRACPDGFVKTSGIFVFNFDNNEIYQFELMIRTEKEFENCKYEIINRNGFNVNISIRVGLMLNRQNTSSSIVYGCLDTGKALKFPEFKWFDTPYNKHEKVVSGLHIHCYINIFTDLCGLNKPTPSRETGFQSFKRLFSDKTFSDFVIICGDETYIDCHRAILANKSAIFRSFFERHCQDNKAYKIDDFDPEIVKQMIHFIYTNEFPEDAKATEALLRIGDKYNVEGLVTLCTTELAKVLDAENAVRCVSL
jgi:hypothetical protein